MGQKDKCLRGVVFSYKRKCYKEPIQHSIIMIFKMLFVLNKSENNKISCKMRVLKLLIENTVSCTFNRTGQSYFYVSLMRIKLDFELNHCFLIRCTNSMA